MRSNLIALPDQPTRVARNALSLSVEGAYRGTFIDGDGAAPPAPAAPAVPAAPAAAPAAAAPAAPAPADGKGAAPAAAPTEKPAGNIVADAGKAAAASTADEQKAYLVEKGLKAEDLAKLSEADLKKAFDEKKAAEKPAADGKPVKAEDIKITVPEGLKIDEAVMTELKGILADATLTPDQRGDKLVAMHAKALQAAANEPYAMWDTTQANWQKDVKADKELGGANFEPMQGAIDKLITSLGKEQAMKIREAFVFTGAGNNPEIIRLLYRAAQAVNEPAHVPGGAPAPDGGKNPASVLYPNQGTPRLANQR